MTTAPITSLPFVYDDEMAPGDLLFPVPVRETPYHPAPISSPVLVHSVHWPHIFHCYYGRWTEQGWQWEDRPSPRFERVWLLAGPSLRKRYGLGPKTLAPTEV